MVASVQPFPMFRGVNGEALMPLGKDGFSTLVARVKDRFGLARQLSLR